MKLRTAVAALVLSMTSGYALADQDRPGKDWMSKADVTQKLEAAGYSSITGLEADDGHWEGKGVKNGKIMEFHVDPHTSAISNEHPDT